MYVLPGNELNHETISIEYVTSLIWYQVDSLNKLNQSTS